ncbi:MAG: hypothetical protein KGM99_20895 [Burkholderiales bacterium]|nr:hypothetical protein [Burkholderiales bacterium]
MTIDRNDPEVKALIEEVTTAATEALAKKNTELLGELKLARAKAKGADIDPAEHAALQTQVEELTEKLTKAEKTGKAEVEKLTKSLAEKDGALTKHLIDAGLTDALVKAGVKPEMLDAVKALHQSKASIEAKDGAYNALIDGKPLAEFVTTWAQSDQGKHFVAAQQNAGGGAAGGGGKGAEKTMTRVEYDQKSAAGDTSLPQFFKDGGKLVD